MLFSLLYASLRPPRHYKGGLQARVVKWLQEAGHEGTLPSVFYSFVLNGNQVSKIHILSSLSVKQNSTRLFTNIVLKDKDDKEMEKSTMEQ